VIDHFLAFSIGFCRDIMTGWMISLFHTLPGCDMGVAFVRLPKIASNR
jgi:hypothetical protein